MNPYRPLFWSLVYIGRSWGGIRPRRIVNWVQRRAFQSDNFSESECQWWRDRWGSELLLNPHYLIDSQIIASGYYDKILHSYIERVVRSGMVCFDVGANIGDVTLHLAQKVGRGGYVHAFEPLTHISKRLAQNIQRNELENVSVHKLALSNRSGTGSFAYAPVQNSNQGMGSLVNSKNSALSRILDVETITVDEFVRTRKIDRLDLMKIDIQGGEIGLLEGAVATLARFSPDLLVEVSPEDLSCGGKNSKDLLALLESKGYRTYEVTTKGTPGKGITSDEISPEYFRENIFCTKRPL